MKSNNCQQEVPVQNMNILHTVALKSIQTLLDTVWNLKTNNTWTFSATSLKVIFEWVYGARSTEFHAGVLEE